jgi:hypothetical protein
MTTRVEQALKAAREYAICVLGPLTECVRLGEDDLERMVVEIEAAFLFPTSNRAELLLLSQLRLTTLRLAKGAHDSAVKRPQAIRQMEAEYLALQKQIAHLRIWNRLTPAEREIVEQAYFVSRGG